MDIKKAARAGQVEAAKVMAKDVVRTRRYQNKMIMMKTQIQAVSLKIQTLKATNSMAKAMAGVTKVFLLCQWVCVVCCVVSVRCVLCCECVCVWLCPLQLFADAYVAGNGSHEQDHEFACAAENHGRL